MIKSETECYRFSLWMYPPKDDQHCNGEAYFLVQDENAAAGVWKYRSISGDTETLPLQFVRRRTTSRGLRDSPLVVLQA